MVEVKLSAGSAGFACTISIVTASWRRWRRALCRALGAC